MNEPQGSGMQCPVTGCPVKYVVLSMIAVFAVIFGFQWLFHGVYMMPAYEATASLWRPKEEMEGMMWVCILTKAVMAFAITGIFCCASRFCPTGGKCPGKGAKFGAMIGLVLGAHDFASYMWLPIPMDMAVKWFAGDLVMGILTGVVLALVKGMCSKGECKA